MDIETLVRRYAEIETLPLPFDVDALCIHSSSARPRVLVNSRRAETRGRFTLAHELGHILIPWHLGSLGCHAADWSEAADMEYRSTEAEANRFASELLMPSAWISEILKTSPTIKDTVESMEQAQVSRSAACFTLIQALPPGYLLVETDREQRVRRTARSSGTTAEGPKAGEVAPQELGKATTRVERIDAGPSCFLWYCLRPTHAPVRPKEDSRTILDRMLWRREKGTSVQQSIAGFVGAAFSRWPPSSVDEAYALLRQRLMQPDLDWFTRDREFDKFIAAKAHELVARPGRKRRE